MGQIEIQKIGDELFDLRVDGGAFCRFMVPQGERCDFEININGRPASIHIDNTGGGMARLRSSNGLLAASSLQNQILQIQSYQWSTGTNTLIGSKPSTKAQRRKDPTSMEYRDLNVGDVVRLDKVTSDTDYLTVGSLWKVEKHFVKEGEKKALLISSENQEYEIFRSHNALEPNWLMVDAALFKPKPKITYESVILPSHKKRAIMDAIGQVHNNDLIFNQWGFGDVMEKGMAVSLLFYGPPGTGKTLMGQAIADNLGRKLQVIGTAEIESSEPGGAERAIKAFFDDAEKNDKVMLFDECDSLIGDRRAIGMILGAQVNCLLQCLENFKGVVLFTTNRLEKLDEAFDRRLSLKLEFEMPDKEHRVAIWQRMFPERAPLAKNIDWGFFAEVPIAGGHIKNVVLRAARRAAASDEKKITNPIIWEALQAEVEALEKFQDAVKSSTMPRLLGGGYSVQRTNTIDKVAGR